MTDLVPSVAEVELEKTTKFDQGRSDWRAEKLQGAVERLNEIAKNVRTINADIEWRGLAADQAREAFASLAAQVNQHADGINGVRDADRATAAPLAQAKADYGKLQDIEDEGPQCYPDGSMSAQEYRDNQARGFKRTLDNAMATALGGCAVTSPGT